MTDAGSSGRRRTAMTLVRQLGLDSVVAVNIMLLQAGSFAEACGSLRYAQ